MLRKDLQKILKPYVNSSSKTRNKVLLTLLTLCCFCFMFGLKHVNTFGISGYVRSVEGSAVTAGTKSGNAKIWPVTHPVFIVQLCDSNGRFSEESQGYINKSRELAPVIPYASTDAMWLCSNDLSSYLDRQNFDTPSQVYLLRKSSETGKKLYSSGGVDNKETTGRVEYLHNYKTTSFNSHIKDGVFFDTLVKYYLKNNKNMTTLANDKNFKKLLSNPNENQVKYSHELWSYITDVNASGSDTTGWTYTYRAQDKIDEYLHVDDVKTGHTGGLLFNKWNKTCKNKVDGYDITTGEYFDLRYLDLLMTLNTISNNKTYWSKGIKNYLTSNTGKSNIVITSGIVARMEKYSTEGGDVEPATIFVSCNDLLQVAYNVKSNYNLSVKDNFKLGKDNINRFAGTKEEVKKDYIGRLKQAVSLSKSSSYKSTSVFSSAIISRIISERVRSVSNGKLVWGSSGNNANLINLLKFEISIKNPETWYAANWILEPPIMPPTVNYQATVKVNSKVFNKIKSKPGPDYSDKPRIVYLKDFYIDDMTKAQNVVITSDVVDVRLSLKPVNSAGKSSGAIKEWKDFIKNNKITKFKIKVRLSRNYNGADFESIPIAGRTFTQVHTPGVKLCESNDWVDISAEELFELLSKNETLGQWTDTSIATLKIKGEKRYEVNYRAQVYITYQANDGKWYYTTGKLKNTKEDDLVVSSDVTKMADVRKATKATLVYTYEKDINYVVFDIFFICVIVIHIVLFYIAFHLVYNASILITYLCKPV